jgi:serine protease Do
MNQRNMWTILGFGALSIGLVALPGASKQTQAPTSASAAAKSYSQASAESLAAAASTLESQAELLQEKSNTLAREITTNIQVLDDPKEDADGNFQFFMGSGGGWLGVGVSEVSAAKMKELKLPEERGAVLGRIVPNSPAAKAGLKENDVVTEINGQRIEGSEQFRRMIHEIPAGRTANLSVWRDGHSQNIKVTLGKPESGNVKVFSGGPKAFSFSMPEISVMPDMSGLDHLRSFALVSPDHPLLGIDAEDVSGEFGKYFGVPEGEGILVRGVFANSAAAKAGIKVGDVITSLNGERIRGASELREKLFTRQEEKTIKLGVLRNKTEMILTVELPQREEHEEHILSERTQI